MPDFVEWDFDNPLGDVIFKCVATAQSYGVAISMISRL
jgi:hypothetical protein